MRTPIVYPESLPCPQTSSVTAADRRLLTDKDRPRGDAIAIQRDRLEFEQVTWPPLNAIQTATLRAWWKDVLIEGGAWFEATWPMPRGRVPTVRKFTGSLQWEFIAGGFWRVSGTTEVRGRGLSPLTAVDDPFDEFNALVLRFDSGNGSTAFLDDMGHIVTATGAGPVESSGAAKFGPSSLTAPDETQYLICNDIDVLARAFTVEGWLRLPVTGVYYPGPSQIRIMRIATVAGSIEHMLASAFAPEERKWSVLIPSHAGLESASVPWASYPTGAFIHSAFSYDGTNARLFVGGTMLDEAEWEMPTDAETITGISIGTDLQANVFMDEVRFTNGGCRYTGDFVPPSRYSQVGN